MIDKYPNGRPGVIAHKEICNDFNRAIGLSYRVNALLEIFLKKIKNILNK